MPPDQKESSSGPLTYLVYDRTNGRVLGRYRRYSKTAGHYCECDPASVLRLFSDDTAVMRRVADADPKNLAVLSHSGKEDENRPVRVSKRGTVESMPRLRLRSDRDVLKGDGKDTVAIQVDVVDDNGRIVRDFRGRLMATTMRGKLSEPGGNISVEKGQATFHLTSTVETAGRVQVRVFDPAGLAVPDALIFQFE